MGNVSSNVLNIKIQLKAASIIVFCHNINKYFLMHYQSKETYLLSAQSKEYYIRQFEECSVLSLFVQEVVYVRNQHV